jgi:hypothetical protein
MESIYQKSAVANPSGIGAKKTAMDKKSKEIKSHDRNDELAIDLAALGYPGFSYLKTSSRKAPAEVVLSALQVAHLEARLVEALPWVLLECGDLDWDWLVRGALLDDLQNKLGFLTNLARRLAERSGRAETARLLTDLEAVLEASRLPTEGTLCHDSITEVERRWLKSNRSKEAEHWGLLTDLVPEHLSYS